MNKYLLKQLLTENVYRYNVEKSRYNLTDITKIIAGSIIGVICIAAVMALVYLIA